MLAGRGQLSVRPEHGPGAAVRNVRQRFSAPPIATGATAAHALDAAREVQMRDLAVYEQLVYEQSGELAEVE